MFVASADGLLVVKIGGLLSLYVPRRLNSFNDFYRPPVVFQLLLLTCFQCFSLYFQPPSNRLVVHHVYHVHVTHVGRFLLRHWPAVKEKANLRLFHQAGRFCPCGVGGHFETCVYPIGNVHVTSTPPQKKKNKRLRTNAFLLGVFVDLVKRNVWRMWFLGWCPEGTHFCWSSSGSTSGVGANKDRGRSTSFGGEF